MQNLGLTILKKFNKRRIVETIHVRIDETKKGVEA